MTILVLYLILESISQIRSGNKKTGALILALGINIKIMPIVILPYLLWRKEFRTAAWCVFFYAALLFLPAVVIGFQQNNFLIKEWWVQVDPTQTKHVIDVEERSFHGLSTLLPTLLMEHVPDVYALPVKRNIANLSETQVGLVLNVVRLLLVGFALFFLRSKPFTAAASKRSAFWELSYIVLLIPLIFPHQNKYCYFYLFPAAYLFYYLFTIQAISKRKKIVTWSVLAFSFLCFNLYLLLGEFNAYYEHFKIITYGALVLIPVLAVCISEEHSL